MTAGLVDRVRRRLIDDGALASPADVAAALRAEGLVLGDSAVLQIVEELRHELVGAGPLEPLLRNPEITDVVVVGTAGTWVDRGSGMERVASGFTSDDDVRRLAQRLAAQAGRRLDESMPTVDARLVDGTRLHAVLAPIAVDGTLISLRIPRRRAFTLDDLVAAGTVDVLGASVLAALVEERISFLVSGGTGSGKTTILAALLGLVGERERIVVVEDSAELRPDHPHVVRMQSRLANAEGAGEVTLRDLVRQSLRMRPDRLVVGEVRGAEVIELLLALNTGHDGCCGTIHANSASDVPARLEALGLTAGVPRDAVHALVAAGLEAIIHVERTSAGVRQVCAVHALRAVGDGRVRAVPIIVRGPAGLRWEREPGDAWAAGKGLRTMLRAGIGE